MDIKAAPAATPALALLSPMNLGHSVNQKSFILKDIATMIRGFAVVVLVALGATSACIARTEPKPTLVGELMEGVVETLELERWRFQAYCSARMTLDCTGS